MCAVDTFLKHLETDDEVKAMVCNLYMYIYLNGFFLNRHLLEDTIFLYFSPKSDKS